MLTLQGWALWRQQLRALLAKRALCALRDAWAALVQVGRGGRVGTSSLYVLGCPATTKRGVPAYGYH